MRAHALVLTVVILGLALTSDDRHAGEIPDGRQMIWTAIAITETGGIGQAPGRDLAVPRAGGDSVSRYGMGMSLAQIPAAALAPRVERILGPGSSQPLFLIAPFLFVLAAGAFAGLAVRELGLPRPAQASAILLATLASPLAAYASLDLAEPLEAAALAAGFLCALRARHAPGSRAIRLAAFAGLAAGVAVLTRSSLLVVAPLTLVPLLDSSGPRRTPLFSAAFAGFAVPAVAWLYFELVRFGRPLASYAGEGFTHPWWDGFWRLLVGPNAGLLWFYPALVAVAAGAWRVFRARKTADLLVIAGALGPTLALLALAASWWAWHGTVGWGPRLLLPGIPLLAVVAAQEMSAWRRPLAAGLVGLALLASVPPLVQNPVPVMGYELSCDWPRVDPDLGRSLPRFARRERDGTFFAVPSQVLASVPQASPFLVLPWFAWARTADPRLAAVRLASPPWRYARPDIRPPAPIPPGEAEMVTRGRGWRIWGLGFWPTPADRRFTADSGLGDVYDSGLANQVLRLQHLGLPGPALRLAQELMDVSPGGLSDALLLESYRLLGRRSDAADWLAQLPVARREHPAINVVLALFDRDRGDEASARALLGSVAASFPGTPVQAALTAPLADWPRDLATMTMNPALEVPLGR